MREDTTMIKSDGGAFYFLSWEINNELHSWAVLLSTARELTYLILPIILDGGGMI